MRRSGLGAAIGTESSGLSGAVSGFGSSTSAPLSLGRGTAGSSTAAAGGRSCSGCSVLEFLPFNRYLSLGFRISSCIGRLAS